MVRNTDFDVDDEDEYVVSTTANGVEVHGKCKPTSEADLDGRNFFECAKMVLLPVSPDGTYTFVTTATPEVSDNAYEGSYVYVEYMVDCEGHCQPPGAPPSPPPPSPPPPSPPPPLPPTCEYSATPAGSGNTTNATSTFTDPHAPMPLPPPAPPAPPGTVRLDIEVPEGANVGDRLTFNTAAGQFSLVVPLGAAPGKKMMVTMPVPANFQSNQQLAISSLRINGNLPAPKHTPEQLALSKARLAAISLLYLLSPPLTLTPTSTLTLTLTLTPILTTDPDPDPDY